MKNIQAQYQDLLEGKMSKSNFMRNVRMQFPQYVSPVTSFDDSIKILKGKRILNEGLFGFGKKEKELSNFPSHMHINTYDLVNNLKLLAKKRGIEMNDIKAKSLINKAWESGIIPKSIPGGRQLSTDAIAMKIAKEMPLNEAKKPEGVYGHNPNAEMDEYRGIDHLNYYQVYHGIQFELAKMPEITDENYIKARKKVVDTIMKDPDAYKDLQLANFKAVKEMDKDLEMKDVKKNNLTDKPNEMKVVEKDAKANTQDTLEKKEKKKSKTAKIPVMTQTPKGKLEAFATPGKEKVMALKEHILDELTHPNLQHEEINVGSRVKKKDVKDYDASKVGNVTEFDGDTATVKWDDDSVEHVQKNILTKKDIPQHPKAAEKFGQIPDSPFVKKEEKSVEEKKKGLKDKLMKVVKEMMFKKGKQAATASTPQSQNALKQAGYTQVPNTQDVQSL